MKIHIIDCSGIGKTYFAKKLSNKYNIPHYDLDNIYWDNSSEKYQIKTEVEKREILFTNILEKDSWIKEFNIKSLNKVLKRLILSIF